MINRINLILRAKNITARQFAEEIGIQPSGMSHIMGGRNNPSLEFVTKVLRRYPEIDANWLLLGKGEMYASSASSYVTPPSALSSTPDPEPHPLPQEPSLFTSDMPDVESNEDAPVLPQQDALPLPAEPSAPEVREPIHHPIAVPASDARLERILFIYNDGTFSEALPRRS